MLGWGPASFVVLFVLSLRRLVMRASSRSSRSVSLCIEGRPGEEPESRQTGGELGSPATVVARVLPIGYLPPPCKGKGKISEIMYPCGSKYLRATVRYADAVGPSRVEPLYAKTFTTRYGPPPASESGVLIFSRLMLFPFLRWSASLRRSLRMVSAFLYTPSSKESYNISMYSQFLGHLGRPFGFFQG